MTDAQSVAIISGVLTAVGGVIVALITSLRRKVDGQLEAMDAKNEKILELTAQIATQRGIVIGAKQEHDHPTLPSAPGQYAENIKRRTTKKVK